jgi:hypothetical protein
VKRVDQVTTILTPGFVADSFSQVADATRAPRVNHGVTGRRGRTVFLLAGPAWEVMLFAPFSSPPPPCCTYRLRCVASPSNNPATPSLAPPPPLHLSPPCWEGCRPFRPRAWFCQTFTLPAGECVAPYTCSWFGPGIYTKLAPFPIRDA